VAVRRSFLDGIWSEPVQFQDLSVLKFKPEEVHRLSVVTDRELSVERTGANDWKWIAGDGALDKVNLQSLLNTLTSLHAVRWAAAADASTQGLDKPQAVITFTTSPDNKAFHKLSIGGPAGDHLWYAKLDERDGVFVLSNPDYTALRLPLTSSTSPSPAPSASVAAPAATP